MPLVINTDFTSLNLQKLLSVNTNALSKSMEELSPEHKINHIADDAVSVQISETLRSQIQGMSQAINNAHDEINLLAVAEGTSTVAQENLQRIRELTAQAVNDIHN